MQRLCDTVLWLEHGGIREFGPAGEVLARYEEDARRQEDEQFRAGNKAVRSREAAVQIEEAAQGISRFRLVSAATAPHVAATYYVRRLVAGKPDGVATDIRIGDDAGTPGTDAAWIDPLGCEWGRLYERNGSTCRLLFPQTGRSPGGMFLIRKQQTSALPEPITLSVELCGDGRTLPQAAFQQYDIGTAEWTTLPTACEGMTRDGWSTYVSRAELPAIDPAKLPELMALNEARKTADVEIQRVYVQIDGQERHVVREWDPFEIVVELEVHREVPLLDVGLKITRNDGSYVFWQSSGQVGGNLERFQGKVRVAFQFDPNCFGAGEYDLTVTCGSGWDLDSNYPYSRVYARAVKAARFVVAQRDARLDLGQISTLVPVVVEPLAAQTRQVA